MKVARNTNLHVSSRGADRDRDALKHAGEDSTPRLDTLATNTHYQRFSYVR